MHDLSASGALRLGLKSLMDDAVAIRAPIEQVAPTMVQAKCPEIISSSPCPPRRPGGFPALFFEPDSRWLRVLFGGQRLLCQFSTEVLLFLSYELFVAARIDERVRSPVFHERIFFFQPEVTAVGTKENIAWQ